MNVLDDPRVTRNGHDFHVSISHGRYQVEKDDRYEPPLWMAYGEDGIWVGNLSPRGESSDPLRSVDDLTRAYDTPEEVIAALLACDGEVVPA